MEVLSFQQLWVHQKSAKRQSYYITEFKIVKNLQAMILERMEHERAYLNKSDVFGHHAVT
jgi:hypothetical protein